MEETITVHYIPRKDTQEALSVLTKEKLGVVVEPFRVGNEFTAKLQYGSAILTPEKIGQDIFKGQEVVGYGFNADRACADLVRAFTKATATHPVATFSPAQCGYLVRIFEQSDAGGFKISEPAIVDGDRVVKKPDPKDRAMGLG